MQQYYLGKYLSEKGVNVNYLSFDYGQSKIYKVDNITFLKTYAITEGIPVFRFLYPRLFRIWTSLKMANADIYYSRGADFLPGILSMFCRMHNRKWVFAAASDTNFMPRNLRVKYFRDRMLYEYGLRRADSVIVQSEVQRKLLRKHYGLKGTVMKNIYPDERRLSKRENDHKHVLWVGRLLELKRPELFIEIAKAFPGERFIMIGGAGSDRQLFDRIIQSAEDVPNLDFKGFMPFEETKAYFDGAKMFINTSRYEGFPNTFLQSWCRGIPVVTLLDPDGVVEKYGLGIVVSSKTELLNAVRNLLESYRQYSERVTQYFIDNHSPKMIDDYVDLFQKLMDREF